MGLRSAAELLDRMRAHHPLYLRRAKVFRVLSLVANRLDDCAQSGNMEFMDRLAALLERAGESAATGGERRAAS